MKRRQFIQTATAGAAAAAIAGALVDVRELI